MFSIRSNQLPAQRILKIPPDAEHNLLLEPTFLINHLIHLAWLEPFGVSVGVPQEDPLFISSYDIAGKPIVTWVCLQSASDLNTLLPLLRCKVVGVVGVGAIRGNLWLYHGSSKWRTTVLSYGSKLLRSESWYCQQLGTELNHRWLVDVAIMTYLQRRLLQTWTSRTTSLQCCQHLYLPLPYPSCRGSSFAFYSLTTLLVNTNNFLACLHTSFN